MLRACNSVTTNVGATSGEKTMGIFSSRRSLVANRWLLKWQMPIGWQSGARLSFRDSISWCLVECPPTRLRRVRLSRVTQLPTNHQLIVFKHWWFGRGNPILLSAQQIHPLLNYLHAGVSILVTGPPFAMCRRILGANLVAIASRREMRQKLLAAG